MYFHRFLTRFHAASVACLALLAAVLLYWVAWPYHVRLDVTGARLYSLSKATRQILAEFGSERISVLAFFPPDHPDRTVFEDLLKEYAYTDPNLVYRFINPDRSPALAEKNNVDAYGITLLRAREQEVRLESVSEQDLTNALAKLLGTERRRVYFLIGHDESELEGRGEDGRLGLATRIRGMFYDVKEIDLRHREIPKDAALVILAGPHADLSLKETGRLRAYVESGGRIFVAIDPVLPGEGNYVAAFLLDFGLKAGNDVVVDPLSRQAGSDFLISVISKYAPHLVAKGVEIPSAFPVARSVRKSEREIADIDVSEFAWTGAQAWAETNLALLEEGKAAYDEGIDLAGPVPVAAIAESRSNKGKLLVVGDSDFLNNAHLHIAGNKDFAIQLISWLLDEKPLIRVSQDELSPQAIVLTAREKKIFLFVCVAGVPVFFLLFALVVHVWRKRFR